MLNILQSEHIVGWGFETLLLYEYCWHTQKYMLMMSHPRKMLTSKHFYIYFSKKNMLENYKLSLERQFTIGHLIVPSFCIKLIFLQSLSLKKIPVMLFRNLDLKFVFDINTIVNVKACNVNTNACQLYVFGFK